MRRIPIVSTIIVAVAVAIMIALGLWQLLDRLPAKESQLRQLAANPALPPIAFPATPDDRLLFRRSTVRCPRPTAMRIIGAGARGFRAIVECRTAGAAQGILVQLGTTRNAAARVSWSGGVATGYLTHAPDSRPLIAGLWDRTPKRLMLVAQPALAGLGPNTAPDPATVPNSHLAYAGQWFFFASIAAIIYALALRRRRPQLG
jgi:surfeit locus 1 family protein